MKNFLLTLLWLITINSLIAQDSPKLDDFGRVVLNTYVSDQVKIPIEAKSQLENKLNQISSTYGIGGSNVNPRFIITANLSVGTKDIIPGPPQMIAQNLEITLYIGDAIENKIFANITISVKGVGNNENKSLIDAIKQINPKNKDISSFIENGRNKIITYYKTQCDFLLKNAKTLTKQEKYDEAIFKLSLVPEVCQDCYFRSLDTLAVIYQKKIDADCRKKFSEAKTIWAANQNKKGAEQAGEILSEISPFASCQPEVSTLIKSIASKLKADEKARWDFKMKQYADNIAAQKEQVRIAEEQSKRDAVLEEKQLSRNFELDKMRIGSYREVSIEYAKHQPKTVTYNNIFWR